MNEIPFDPSPLDPSKLILIMKVTFGTLGFLAMIACGSCSVMHPMT